MDTLIQQRTKGLHGPFFKNGIKGLGNFLGPGMPGDIIPSGEKLDLTTFTTEAFVGANVLNWDTPSSAEVSDNLYASLAVGTLEYSKYLQGVGIADTREVPSDATINGIEVIIEKKKGVGSNTTDKVISLVKGGVIQGNNKADTVTEWPTSDTIFTYGGPSDLWGLALTPADVNASDFGAALSFSGGAIFGQGFIDHIQIAVYYS